jgi:hypothetical protein
MAAAESEHVAFIVLLAAPGVPMPELLALQAERITRAEGGDEETVKAMGELNREITALILSGAGPDSLRAGVRDIVRRQLELNSSGEPTGEAVEALVQSNIQQFSTPWFQYFIRYDPREALRKVTVPVLALFGSLDTQVDADQNMPAVKKALEGNSDVTVRSMPGLNHMFQHAVTGGVGEYTEIDETISPEVLDIVTEWISARFGEGE